MLNTKLKGFYLTNRVRIQTMQISLFHFVYFINHDYQPKDINKQYRNKVTATFLHN